MRLDTVAPPAFTLKEMVPTGTSFVGGLPPALRGVIEPGFGDGMESVAVYVIVPVTDGVGALEVIPGTSEGAVTVRVVRGAAVVLPVIMLAET